LQQNGDRPTGQQGAFSGAFPSFKGETTRRGGDEMAKKNRFYLKRYFPDLPAGWGLYDDKEIEEKLQWERFLMESRHYKTQFESGDENAIFTFARSCQNCLREVWTFSDGTSANCYSHNNFFSGEHGRSWVIEQIERWKAEGTPQAKNKLKRFFSAYSDSRGQKEKPVEIDLFIYRQLKERIDNGVSFNNAVEALIDDAHEGKLGKEAHKMLAPHIFDDQVGYYNTFHEIYYKLQRLEREYLKDKPTTIENLRFEYFTPMVGATIPVEYEEQFKRELSLFCDVEWERKGFISFPQLRQGIYVHSGMKPFREERLPLRAALEKVSKKTNVPLDELTQTYSDLKHIEASYFENDCLKILNEL
jgi:hypothetical protein